MIEVNYNEYKETLAENMKLIVENHDLKERVEELSHALDEARKFIEKYCVYDEHLQGYCMGLSTGEVKKLVRKMGGRNGRRK